MDEIVEPKIGVPFIPSVSEDDMQIRRLLVSDLKNEEAAEDDLTEDAIGDDRTDIALKARFDSYEQAGALNWLLEGGQAKTPDAQLSKPEDVKKGPPDSLTSTVLTGLGEMPRQAFGGVIDAAQSILELGEWVETQAPVGGFQITDAEGGFDPKLLGPEARAERIEKEGKQTFQKIPTFDPAETIAGSAVRTVAQFLAPFGAVSKAIGGLKAATTAGAIAKPAVAGSIADFLGFVGDEGRLSDLIQEFPSLQNPVTEWLATDKDDSQIEGRLKNAIEGLGLGVATEGLFRGFKAFKKFRTLAREKNGADLTAEALRTATDEQVLRKADDMSLLGTTDKNVPLVISEKTIAKLKVGIEETEAGVPDDVLARSLTTKGLTKLQGADGVYINFAKIETADDIQRIIQDTASGFKGDIDKARRGVRTNKQTKLSADKIDAWETLIARRKGDALNAEESVAVRQLWATTGDKLGEVAEAAAKNPTPENLFQFRKMLATHHVVQKEVIAARSEAGRTLQSWAMPVGGSTERMSKLMETLDKTGGSEVALKLAQRVAIMARTPNAAGALSHFAENGVRAKAVGSVQEYWINALLSGPKTHMVNMMSNTGVVGMSILERGVAARFGRMFSDEAGVEIGEAMAQIQGIRGGIWDAFRNFGKAWRTGQTGYGMNKIELPRERHISSGTWNRRSDSWFGQGVDGIGSIVNAPGRLLQAEDEIFKTIGYRMELHAQAQRMVSREIKEGKLVKDQIKARTKEILDNPPEAIRLESASAAAYQTFTNPPGNLTKGIMSLVSKAPVLRFVVPFINTPANILKYTFERTPLAPTTAKYRNAIAKGGADADLARTKMAIGTMGLMLGMDLALSGHTTGSGPKSIAEKQNWRRKGNQPYSVRLGNTNIAFNRLDPLGYHLGISSDIAEYVMNTQEDDATAAEIEEAMAATVFSVAENITSKSYMQGLSMLIGAIEDPERFASRYMERFASSFIPTGVREVATFIDPVQRASHDIVSSLKAKIPFMSDDLPARRDLWGKEIRYQSGLGRTYDAISPLYGSTYNPEPIDLAMEKDGWFVGIGGQGLTIEGETVSLRNEPEIKNRYYEIRGATKPSEMGIEADWLIDRYGDATLLETLNGMVEGTNDLTEAWLESEDPEDRERLTRRIVSDYGKAARNKVMQEFPRIEESALRQKESRNLIPETSPDSEDGSSRMPQKKKTR